MGRGKLHMELIKKEKSRITTYKKRKEGLLRKLHEFTTLCDVSACMIIYGPKQEAVSGVEPEVWPENQEVVKQLIDIYGSKSKDSGNCRVYGLGDFFEERKRRMEDELEKLKKKNNEAKYPTWVDFLNLLSEMQLRSLASGLTHKLEVVKNRIDSIKGSNHDHQQQNQFFSEGLGGGQDGHLSMMSKPHHGLIQRGIELDLMNHQQQQQEQVFSGLNHPMEMHYPNTTIDQVHHQLPTSINQNPMMMLLMNDNDNQHQQQQQQHHHQILYGGPASCNVQRAAFKHQVFYESTGGIQFNNMLYNDLFGNSRPLARYYPPALQPVQSQYGRCPVRPNAPPPPPPQLYSSRENVEGNEFAHYRIKD